MGSPYDKLKMPTFYLNDDQVHAIVTFVISNRDRLISAEPDGNSDQRRSHRLIAHGRELTERYNCVSCPSDREECPADSAVLQDRRHPQAAPPSLRGEGNKIQYNWLFNFFKNVEQMRPLLFEGIHMPSFPATDEEFSSIIAYFNTVSNKESKELTQADRPGRSSTSISRKRRRPSRPAKPSEPQPGDDWWQKPGVRRFGADLKDWGLTFGHIKPVEIGIARLRRREDYRKTYAKLLFKAQFTRELYDVPFPFVDTPRRKSLRSDLHWDRSSSMKCSA